MDVSHASVSFDLPALDAVIVVARMGAADLDQRLSSRLAVSGLIDASALKDGFPTIPCPRPSKSRVAFRKHGFLQLGGVPAAASIDRDLDAHDPSPAAPRQAPNFLETGTKLLPPRRTRND